MEFIKSYFKCADNHISVVWKHFIKLKIRVLHTSVLVTGADQECV